MRAQPAPASLVRSRTWASQPTAPRPASYPRRSPRRTIRRCCQGAANRAGRWSRRSALAAPESLPTPARAAHASARAASHFAPRATALAPPPLPPDADAVSTPAASACARAPRCSGRAVERPSSFHSWGLCPPYSRARGRGNGRKGGGGRLIDRAPIIVPPPRRHGGRARCRRRLLRLRRPPHLLKLLVLGAQLLCRRSQLPLVALGLRDDSAASAAGAAQAHAHAPRLLAAVQAPRPAPPHAPPSRERIAPP
jgi:hypothetical protein